MKASLDWLKDYVKIDAPADVIADRLTMIGLEVEAIERISDDVVFEINVTPNRPDCLSIIGIARELSAAFGKALNLPDLNIVAEAQPLDFNIEIIQPDLCPRYAGRIVKGVKVGRSPEWMRARLEKCGIRSINNIVDITNYVLLEFGQPLHAFDLKTLKGNMIRVGAPKAIAGLSEIKFRTLDGAERDIPGDSLLIWDGERPVAVAGVMGGLDTEVTENTTDILIESAYFAPASIRRTSKALGLRTDASYRFERGSDIKALKKALDRAALLMRDLAGGYICGKIDIYPKRFHPREVYARFDRINRLLGLNLSPEDILSCLRGLGLDIYEQTASGFTVKVPPFRQDITMEADIIEEVARFYGYDRIPAELPEAIIGGVGQKEKLCFNALISDIRQSFLKTGFNEAINLSFMGSVDLDLLAIPADDPRRQVVRVLNPLREEEAFMRSFILPALLRNIIYNVSHGVKDIRLFEISRVFESCGERELPHEKQHVAAVYFRDKTKTLYMEETPEFYIVKGVLEAIFDSIGIVNISYVRSSEPFLHPGRSADIFIDGKKIGFIGDLSPEVIEKLDIRAAKPVVTALEIDIDNIACSSRKAVIYRHLPKYPYVERDTAVILDSHIEAAAIMEILKSYPSDLVEDITIFDVYQGKGIEEGKKSVAFNVRYRSREKTLTDLEVEKLHAELVGHLISKTGGRVRA